MSDPGLSAEVLGKLLVALQTLDVLPDERGMAAFLQPALSEVPGVADAFMCLDGEFPTPHRPTVAGQGLRCPHTEGFSHSAPLCLLASTPSCLLEDQPNVHLVSMDTPRQTFGCLQLFVDDEAQFKAYKPFLVNIGHMVATILENRANAQSLAAANAELTGIITLTTLPQAISAFRAVRNEAGQVVDFEWTYVNAAEEAQHPDTTLVGSRLLEIHPEYRQLGLFDACCEVLESGGQSVTEVKHAHGQLGAEFAEFRASRLGDGVVVALLDVTERHVAAQRLAESEERYRLLAENASDVVMLLTPEWTYQWVSGSVAEVLGWSAADLVGQAIDEFIHPRDLAQFRKVIADTAPENPASVEFRYRRADGTYRWVAGRTRVTVDDDGAPVSVVGGFVDITDRKATEARERERLRELEQFKQLTIGRELKMITLKKEIEHLKRAGSNADSTADRR
jgi:PAS domain S-box-containing protein